MSLVWCLVAGPLLLLYLARQMQVGWTDGAGHPFGEDFINFWSASHLSLNGQVAWIYDLGRFHAFQETVVGAPIDLYHYSYPPVAWLLTAPFGALPYGAAWLLWQAGGWLAFALAVRRIAPGHWMLIAVATPAVFINALGGQNGCWTAAMIGWGLLLLRARPVWAGAVLALFVVKPQLGWLVPIALLAGGQWRALAAFAVAGAFLLLASVMAFGITPWLEYIRQATVLKAVILEDGSGTWHRMLSIFVFVRHAGASLAVAYAAQVVASAVVGLVIFRVWRRDGPTDQTQALLILGMLAGSLYVSDYDCVMATFAVCWLWPSATNNGRVMLGALMVAPLIAASVAVASQLALAAACLWAAFVAASRTGPRRMLVRPEGAR